MNRYFSKVEIVSVSDINEALRELERAPANALLVNASPFSKPGGTIDALKSLPYQTPAILCWLPGKDKTAEEYGVSQYLIKPVSREMLVSAIESIGTVVNSVIIIDDEIELLQLFTRMLNSTGKKFKVWRARNGADAIDLMRKRHPDVAILDLMMPVMDGYQVIDFMHADENLKDIPTIIVSSRDPNQEVWISNSMTVMRGGGFSVDELLNSIQTFSEIFSSSKKLSPAILKTPDG
jgi:CheY-like chemotaxis protein